MKIVLVANFQVEYAAALASALAEDHDLTLLVWDRFAPLLDDSLFPRANVRFLAKPKPRDPRNLLDGVRILRNLHRDAPDVVHLQNPYTWHAPWTPFLREFPLVVTVHDPVPHLGRVQPHWRALYRWTLRWTNATIVHGEAMRDLLCSAYAHPPEKVHVIPHGLFSHFAHAHATDTEPIDVLFFGRILPYKGLDVLLQADPLIRNHLPDYRLAIVGEGNLAPYRSLIPSGPCVKIVNRFVSRGEASRFLRSAKVVVLPYIDASQSGVAAAALGVGTPVVVTAVGSLPEIIQDGRTGLVVPPNDPAALAEAISSLLTDEALRKRVGKGIKESAVNLSWDVVAKRTTQVYEAVKCESHS